MDLFDSIFKFFTDSNKKFSHKTILVLFSIFIIIVLDNVLSFSYYYNNEKKISQIESINNIVKDSSITIKEKNSLIFLRNNIISHKTWKDNIWDFFTTIEFKDDLKSSTEVNNSSKKDIEIKKINNTVRNYYIHFITSSWIFLLVILIFSIVGFSDKNTSFLTALMIILFFITPFSLFLGWIFAKIFSFIPIIQNNPIYNYILNFVLSFVIILIFGFLINRIKKKDNIKHYS
jgi:hypothetical protein